MGHDHAHGRAGDRRRLVLALVLSAVVIVVELVGAWLAGSLALLGDAGHVATDTASMLLALGASYVAARPAGPRSTFGYHRAEILAATVNAVVLLGVCGYLVYAGVHRLMSPVDVASAPLVGFGLLGLAANAGAVVLLTRGTDSLNMRAAATEAVSDAFGSLLAVAAGVVIAATGWHRADPVASLAIAALILPRSVYLLKEALVVLLELAPKGLSLDDVRDELMAVDGVADVHDLHAWTITSGLPSLSAHVTVTDDCLANHGAGPVLDQLCEVVSDRFGVRHATFQIEPATHHAHEDLGDVH